jgi:crossover junction endodeoxyribonuclease RusA
MIRLTLPVPPSLNHYLRGRVYKTQEAKIYQSDVQVYCAQQGVLDPTDKPIKVTFRWYPERKSGDLDNRIKVLQDALEGYAYVNDRQIREIHAYRMKVDRKNPRVEIEIEVIE